MSESANYIFEKTDDGIKYIGDFDGLYLNDSDPWGQKSNPCYRQRRLLLLNALLEINPSSVLDVGCGLGHVTQLSKILVADDTIGIDISEVAIDMAKEIFPDVTNLSFTHLGDYRYAI